MIIEVRTYQLKPGSLAEVEKRFGEALPGREKLSKLAALWHTEVGPLNEITHVWPYESFEQRAAVRAEAIRIGVWPPNTSEFIVSTQNEIFLAAPFSPPLGPREVGPLFEIRSYTYAPGALPGVMERWAAAIGERVKLSPLVGAWYSEIGGLNKWVHIWAYKDPAERQQIRAEAIARGIWPPGSAGPGLLLKQENKLVMPASFSPLRQRTEGVMQVGTALSVLAQAGRPDAALYHEHTALGDLAEPLGFDSLFALAHHFTGYLMSSARPATAGSLRGRMKRVALGTCVIVLPWHDSIRVTEQIALLDAHRHNIRRRKY